MVPAVGPVQMAQMVSRATQSEMRIGLTTSEFGAVEVRTLVRANDVGVAIGSERGDLRSLLANEIPGLAHRLQQQSLRLSQVNFHESSAFSGNSSPEENSQRRFFVQPARVHSQATETGAETSRTRETESASSRHAGLSVLA
jgi:flagellar hook-length control protein FliK